MKKALIFSLHLFAMAVILNGCRKEANTKLPGLSRFPLPQLAKVAGTDQVISAQDADAFQAQFTVGLYFENDPPPQQFDVVIIKNENKTAVKTIQSNVTSFPTTINLTGLQLATLFGEPIVLGDKFDVSVDVILLDGAKFEAFPLVGNSYAAGIAAQPGSNTVIRYEAVCKYESSQYAGSFLVVSDEWGDYVPNTIVPLTKIDDTHFSFKYAASDPRPIIVTVNAITNAVSVARQVYGSGYPPDWPWGDISVESVPSTQNFVAPCSGTFSVRLKHTVAAGSFGEYTIVLRKE